jgi:hypothetical protein
MVSALESGDNNVDFNGEENSFFEPYAKLFLTEEYGQILVTFNLDDPPQQKSIDMTFQLKNGEKDVISQVYDDSDPDYLIARQLFDEITEEIAIEAINDFMDMTGG